MVTPHDTNFVALRLSLIIYDSVKLINDMTEENLAVGLDETR